MENNSSGSLLEKGKTHMIGNSVTHLDKKWNPHPTFRGVFLKHIITGAQTDNRFSSHIVRIDPECALEEHIHDGKTELHEVMEGFGICLLNGREVTYYPGDCAVIPCNIRHEVVAGKNGLILHAKFMPALL